MRRDTLAPALRGWYTMTINNEDTDMSYKLSRGSATASPRLRGKGYGVWGVTSDRKEFQEEQRTKDHVRPAVRAAWNARPTGDVALVHRQVLRRRAFKADKVGRKQVERTRRGNTLAG